MPLVYLQLEPAGYWTVQKKLREPFLAAEVDYCGLYCRSQLACAKVFALRRVWNAGALRFPWLFSTHHLEAPPSLTRRQAPFDSPTVHRLIGQPHLVSSRSALP